MPDAVTAHLLERLDSDLRQQVRKRQDGMLRELRYLNDQRDYRLLAVRRRGWSDERLTVLCGLNAFYQLVLGPVASSARERTGVLGRDSVILYGKSIRFDADRNRRIRAALMSFMRAIEDVPASQGVLTAPRFDDLLFRLHRELEDNHES